MTDQLSLRRRMFGSWDVTSCLRTRRELQRFVDGEAPPAIGARVTRHLSACRACGREAQTYRDIKESVQARGTQPAAAALHRLRTFTTTLTRPHD